MHNHWLNNIIIAVVGGWQVLKQTFLSLWFLHCMYLSFIFDALQISFYIICRINCRYFCVFQASKGKHGTGMEHQTGGTEGRRKTVAHTDVPRQPRAYPRSPEKRQKMTTILQIILPLFLQATKSKNPRNVSLITLKSATTYPPEIRRFSVTMAFPFGLNQRICLTSHSLILSMNIFKPSLVVILFKPKT